MPEVYPINFDCVDCAEDGYCTAWGHPCSSINCTEKKEDQPQKTENEISSMVDNKKLIQLWSNDKKRKTFLEAYRDWGMWLEITELGMKYYRYQLPDGTLIIIQEHHSKVYDQVLRDYVWGRDVFYYVQKNDIPIFSPNFKQSISYVADLLKNAKTAMQKKAKDVIPE